MTKLSIPDMSCNHCKVTVETTIKSLDPNANLDFDLSGRKVDVKTTSDAAEMIVALKAVGYEAVAV